MSTPSPAAVADFPLAVSDPDRVRRARDVLDRAGYDLPRIAVLLGPEAPTVRRQLEARFRPLLLRRCAGDSPLEILVRLFLLGDEVDAAAARKAVTPMTLEEWEALKLLRIEGTRVRALTELAPGDGLLMALPVRSRVAATGGGDIHVVMSPRSSTPWMLAQFMIRRPSATTLDVGCGCGVLGLLAAGHSRRLAAGDSNPHAVNVTAFNAHLNRVADFDGRVGDFFTPFQGQTFDHIVSNPPHVISPHHLGDTDFVEYREAGLPGDRVSELVVRSTARLLRPGGYGQVTVNWAHVRGEDDEERVRGWIAGSGCDAWVLRFTTKDAAHYAAEWAVGPDGDADDAFGPTYDAWTAYYDRQGIEAISFGLVIRAAPGKANWFTCQQAPPLIGPCGDALERGFARRDFLATSDEAALLATRLRVAPQARWEQQWRLASDEWEAVSAELKLIEGLAATLHLDGNALAVVHALRGDRPLGDVLHELAGKWGEPPAAVVGPCLRLVRCLVEHGFVAPVSGDGAAANS